MKLYRLLEAAVIDHVLRQPGHVFELKDGEIGPYKTVLVHPSGEGTVAIANHDVTHRHLLKDVPLYEEVKD